MPTIRLFDYDDLPVEMRAGRLRDNGFGKEYASYIVIQDDDGERVYSDAVEPEDATLSRDFDWVAIELQKAYDRIQKLERLDND